MLDAPELRAAARESRYLRDFADRTAGLAALALGDLGRCLEIAGRLSSTPSMLMAASAVRLLCDAALLAGDEAGGRRRSRRSRNTPPQASRHTGGGRPRDPSTIAPRRAVHVRVDPEVRPENFDARRSVVGQLVLAAVPRGDRCRRSGRSRSRSARLHARDTPLGQAVLATLEATASQDEDRWHAALALAVEHGLRWSASTHWRGLPLLPQRAKRGRSASGWLPRPAAYATRPATDGGSGSSRSASMPRSHRRPQRSAPRPPSAAAAEGASWTGRRRPATRPAPVVSGSGRATAGRRLTPTEQQVVALVAEGLTNPQIAERLLMGGPPSRPTSTTSLPRPASTHAPSSPPSSSGVTRLRAEERGTRTVVLHCGHCVGCRPRCGLAANDRTWARRCRSGSARRALDCIAMCCDLGCGGADGTIDHQCSS